MALVTRDLLPFPLGDNSSDTLINGIHFNVTTLKNWNYTYYSNQTISNSSSKCLLMFDKYIPTALYENGTFINSVSCFEPILGHGIRSIVGMTCGLLCAVSFILTFRNFAKHGELHLKAEQQQRWNPISRKFKWYWMFAVSIFGTIGGLTAMDIDRYYLPQIPIMISNIFWFFMILATLAAVWESVRHWGSWQERQMIDPDPFLLLENRNDFRSKVRLYLPLVFYAFLLTVSPSKLPTTFNTNLSSLSSWSVHVLGPRFNCSEIQNRHFNMQDHLRPISASKFQLCSCSFHG